MQRAPEDVIVFVEAAYSVVWEMSTYMLFWSAGGLVGVLAGLLVLRHRGAFSAAMLVAYAGAALGLVYGA